MVTILKVEGMTCGGCVGSVERALLAIKGVESASADLDGATATVTHDGTATVPALIEALDDAGYDAAAQ
jgi:copper chaperone CopZ